MLVRLVDEVVAFPQMFLQLAQLPLGCELVDGQRVQGGRQGRNLIPPLPVGEGCGML